MAPCGLGAMSPRRYRAAPAAVCCGASLGARKDGTSSVCLGQVLQLVGKSHGCSLGRVFSRRSHLAACSWPLGPVAEDCAAAADTRDGRRSRTPDVHRQPDRSQGRSRVAAACANPRSSSPLEVFSLLCQCWLWLGDTRAMSGQRRERRLGVRGLAVERGDRCPYCVRFLASWPLVA